MGAQGPAGITTATTTTPVVVRTVIPGWAPLRDIAFDTGRTDIQPVEMNKISEVAAYMRQNPTVRLGIDGYTDTRGTYTTPTLGQLRMTAVRDALIQSGVPADRIEFGTFSADRAQCDEANALCRRVEVRARTSG
jgi:outer membrane protein OmpA-like peptidoglycan-associated protein